jgi:hypothetical protein
MPCKYRSEQELVDSCGTSDPSASCYVGTGVELGTAVVLVIRQPAARLVQEGAGAVVTAVVLVIRQLSAMLVQEGAGAGVTAVVLVRIAGHNQR